VSVYSIAGQQSNMLWCFNDTVGCSIPRFIIIYCVLVTGNVMSVVLPAATFYLFWVLWEPL